VPIDIVGVGLNATDTLIPVSQYPVSGSKVEIRSASVLPGGQVASAMVACQRWGLRARYVGKLGDDAAADLHRAEFARAGVEAKIITARDCASHQSFILSKIQAREPFSGSVMNVLPYAPKNCAGNGSPMPAPFMSMVATLAAAISAAGWAREAGIPVVADLDELYPTSSN